MRFKTATMQKTFNKRRHAHVKQNLLSPKQQAYGGFFMENRNSILYFAIF